MSTDDREEFEAEKQHLIKEMGRDGALFESAVQLLLKADKYKYSYLWSWMGVPIIQRPADIIALQEVIWETKPDIIVETGVARGGSMVFFASMLALLGNDSAKVIGVDIDIRAHNRSTIIEHPMAGYIELVEGSSIADGTIEQVRSCIPTNASVMVVLDSNHAHDHVLVELERYSALVTPNQCLVVADTILGFIPPKQTPTYYSQILAHGNEPLSALTQFLRDNDMFEEHPINGKMIMSSSPRGFLRRLDKARE
jgi:cephalosporin hydroxylase